MGDLEDKERKKLQRKVKKQKTAAILVYIYRVFDSHTDLLLLPRIKITLTSRMAGHKMRAKNDT